MIWIRSEHGIIVPRSLSLIVIIDRLVKLSANNGFREIGFHQGINLKLKRREWWAVLLQTQSVSCQSRTASSLGCVESRGGGR